MLELVASVGIQVQIALTQIQRQYYIGSHRVHSVKKEGLHRKIDKFDSRLQFGSEPSLEIDRRKKYNIRLQLNIFTSPIIHYRD